MEYLKTEVLVFPSDDLVCRYLGIWKAGLQFF